MKNKMLSQSVADNILSMITAEKRFPAGSQLPNETDLANELSVSRTTLREEGQRHPPYSTGVNIMSGTARFCSRFPCRCTTLLWTACTSES